MKKTIISTLLVIICLFSLISCGNQTTDNNLWETATYSEDTVLGEGEKTFLLEVTAEEKTVTFTVKTDKETVGAALAEQELIVGEQSEYGLYTKVVNGITADFDVNKRYWAFYIDGEYATSGVDTTKITEGTTYQLVYSK